jgi:hypothetical protein
LENQNIIIKYLVFFLQILIFIVNKQIMGAIKLSPTKVRNIRNLYRSGGWTHLLLSVKYGVSRGHITKVINKMRWNDSNYPTL